jgi:BACON domain-containing protein
MENIFRTSSVSDRVRAIAVGMLAAVALITSTTHAASAATSAQGFGATTPGGSGQPIVHVTNLDDAGPGSLRDAVSKGYRTIVFDVAGDIVLTNHLYVYGPFVTIDGFSAPAPGITLRNYGVILRGNRGGNNMIVRGLRIRNATIDGVQIAYGASNILVEHVSVAGSADGNLDITESSKDVTVAWSIFAAPIGESKNSLIKYNPSRVTLHHNIFVKGRQRNPQIRVDDAGTAATDTTADVRNNLIWDWNNYGSIVWYGPRANLVNNFYSAPSGSSNTKKNAIIVCQGECDGGVAASRAWAHVSGNVSADNLTTYINAKGNTATPFPAPYVDTDDACTAAQRALTDAGVQPRDAVDIQYLTLIKLPSCGPAVTPTLAATPTSLAFDAQQGGVLPAPKTVSVRELSGLPTAWTVRTTAPWISVTPSSGATPVTLGVTVDQGALSPGHHDGTVVVEAFGGTPSVQVPVTLQVAPAPAPVPTPPDTTNTGGGSTVTVTLHAVNSGDDASESQAGTVRVNELAQRIGRAYLQGWRFTSVAVPPQAVIVSAKLELYGVSYTNEDVVVRYIGEASPNAAPFVGTARSLSSRAMTEADVVDTPAPWKKGSYNAVPDVASIVQEIVAMPGWRSGSALALFAADDGSDAVRMVGTAETAPVGTLGARLTITYQLP